MHSNAFLGFKGANVFGLGKGGVYKALKLKFSTKTNTKYKCLA